MILCSLLEKLRGLWLYRLTQKFFSNLWHIHSVFAHVYRKVHLYSYNEITTIYLLSHDSFFHCQLHFLIVFLFFNPFSISCREAWLFLSGRTALRTPPLNRGSLAVVYSTQKATQICFRFIKINSKLHCFIQSPVKVSCSFSHFQSRPLQVE